MIVFSNGLQRSFKDWKYIYVKDFKICISFGVNERDRILNEYDNTEQIGIILESYRDALYRKEEYFVFGNLLKEIE